MPCPIHVYSNSDKDIQMCGTVIIRSHYWKLDFSMIPIPLAIFLLMYLICADHLSLLSMITPRNFVSFTSCILVCFITIWSAQWEEYLGIKNIKLVLSMFKDNLFAFTQALILVNSSLTCRIMFLRSIPVQKRLHSSAKSIGIKKLDTFVKSLIYKKAWVLVWILEEHHISSL